MNQTMGYPMVYRVDHLDRITYVDEQWGSFAAANGAGELAVGAITGTRLWDHLSDPTTCHLYQLILGRIREQGRGMRIPFRCDAPASRRFMELSLNPLPGQDVELVSKTLREETRDRVALLDSSVPRAGELIRVCSWCKRVATPEWLEVEAAVRKLGLFDGPVLPPLSHGICEDCHAAVLDALEEA